MYTSSFGGLNTALRGLLAQQASMDVTGHNISNLNTEGYTRQRAELKASTPLSAPGYGQVNPGQIGTGVDVVGFERLRDQYIDRNLRNQFGFASSADAQVGTLGQIEAAFAEPGGSGISELMRNFFGALEDVASAPGDLPARQAFASEAAALAQGFNRLSSELTAISTESGAKLSQTVTEVNSITSRIAQLNSQIRDTVYAGLQPNDLLDERDRLMDDLATKINFDYTVNGAQEVTISFAMPAGPAIQLVDPMIPGGSSAITVADLTTAFTGPPQTLTGGSAHGDLEVIQNVIPGYIARLDALANDFMTGFNAQQAAGFDLAGNAGQAIFAGGTAATMTLAVGGVPPATIMQDPRRIAAASTWAGAGEPGNGNNANALLALRANAQAALGGGTWESYYGATVAQVGSDSAAAQKNLQNRSLLVETLEGRRQEVSGVSLDEEMSNMLRFQHAYNASARVMTAVDEALDVLINRMGRVGL